MFSKGIQQQSGKTTSCRRQRKGFTLVELLVVIGIIAVLIGILLPALNKARRSAKAVQCASNMKQVATAILMYANANHGVLPPVKVDKNAAGPYQSNDFYWSNELVIGKYITAPNVYDQNNKVTNIGAATAFRCPEGADTSSNGTTNVGNFPADGTNDSYNLVTYTDPTTGKKFGIPNWYTLASRVATGTNAYPGGNRIAPFVWMGNGDYAEVNNPAYQRKLSQIKKSSEVIMVLEGNNYNSLDQGTGTHRLQRVAARHGKKTGDGTNAYTNVAFFDGHVALFPTAPWDLATTSAAFDNFKQGTIGYLNKQK
jgi:prepilin-type N-terminal cleavage/methylation domain-containing protein/prepilin-type processing-associated H-X9-DG protein